MKQPKKVRSKEATTPPEALLTAAFRVFASRGYRATRLEEVAEEAGLTKGAIYYHFDSKEDLLRRAVEHRHEAIFAAMEIELATLRAPASVRIRYVLRQLWRHVLEPVWGQAVRLMFGEVGIEFPALFRMWAEEGPIQAWTVVRELIEDGVRSGEFRPGVDPEVAARFAVSGLMMQAALQVHSGLEDLAPCDVDRIFDSGVDLLLHGLAVMHRTAHEHGGDGAQGLDARPTGALQPLRPIGRVENDFDVDAPTDTISASVSRIVIDPELTEALSGLEPGQRVLVLFWFHQAGGSELLQHPRGDIARPVRGVFALRSPRRPNPIGATVVELVGRSGNVLEVRGLDAINGTPVLDLKPD
jgi:tRNA (adenine37-N6)-methyltransferase